MCLAAWALGGLRLGEVISQEEVRLEDEGEEGKCRQS